MTYNDMKQGIRYIVTKGSDNGTFEHKDAIYTEDGKLYCLGDSDGLYGWINAEDVEEATRGMECEVDQEWLAMKREKLKDELDSLLELAFK